MDSDGIIGSCAELFSNRGRVGSCGDQECLSVEKQAPLGYVSEEMCTVKAGLSK